jgi:flagellar biosynthesis protein
MMKYERKTKDRMAAALGYTPGVDSAPRVLAAGKGALAEHIIKVAEENSVTVHKDAALAEALSGLQTGSEIPSVLYEVVAHVLLFVTDIDKKLGEKNETK